MDEGLDQYRSTELSTLLLQMPANDQQVWARAVVLRAIETGGSEFYRDDRLSSPALRRLALESLSTAYRVLEPRERELMRLVVLLTSWERLRRDTGLSVQLEQALDRLAGESDLAEWKAAIREVLDKGPDAVRHFELWDALAQEQCRGGIDIELPSEMTAGRTGLSVHIGRAFIAKNSFRPHGWESNLRRLIPWWLARLGTRSRNQAVARLLRRIGTDTKSLGARFQLLGLASWMLEHPRDAGSETVLERCISSSEGSVRKAGAKLAAVRGNREALEKLAVEDNNRAIRTAATKLLESLAESNLE